MPEASLVVGQAQQAASAVRDHGLEDALKLRNVGWRIAHSVHVHHSHCLCRHSSMGKSAGRSTSHRVRVSKAQWKPGTGGCAGPPNQASLGLPYRIGLQHQCSSCFTSYHAVGQHLQAPATQVMVAHVHASATGQALTSSGRITPFWEVMSDWYLG
ncbi:MAG: hypothetical protein VXZ35_10290, partial [Pseudomonadota bacterium]|nr:hypothetical protein [Pseudomonadota bacterium]